MYRKGVCTLTQVGIRTTDFAVPIACPGREWAKPIFLRGVLQGSSGGCRRVDVCSTIAMFFPGLWILGPSMWMSLGCLWVSLGVCGWAVALAECSSLPCRFLQNVCDSGTCTVPPLKHGFPMSWRTWFSSTWMNAALLVSPLPLGSSLDISNSMVHLLEKLLRLSEHMLSSSTLPLAQYSGRPMQRLSLLQKAAVGKKELFNNGISFIKVAAKETGLVKRRKAKAWKK